MKSYFKIWMFSVLIPFVGIHMAMSQGLNSDNTIYRVTAFKKGNNNVVSVSNTVEIMSPLSIYIPNAFTPDGDGLNDIFLPQGEGITEFSIQIYNRWGELIFESNNSNIGWDGKFGNELVPMGTYVYKVSAKGPGIRKVEKTGNISVVFSS